MEDCLRARCRECGIELSDESAKRDSHWCHVCHVMFVSVSAHPKLRQAQMDFEADAGAMIVKKRLLMDADETSFGASL